MSFVVSVSPIFWKLLRIFFTGNGDFQWDENHFSNFKKKC